MHALHTVPLICSLRLGGNAVLGQTECFLLCIILLSAYPQLWATSESVVECGGSSIGSDALYDDDLLRTSPSDTREVS
jgi:hypothetical protein